MLHRPSCKLAYYHQQVFKSPSHGHLAKTYLMALEGLHCPRPASLCYLLRFFFASARGADIRNAND